MLLRVELSYLPQRYERFPLEESVHCREYTHILLTNNLWHWMKFNYAFFVDLKFYSLHGYANCEIVIDMILIEQRCGSGFWLGVWHLLHFAIY